MTELSAAVATDLFEVLSALALYAGLCRAWWWSLADWREDNRYPETHLDKPPRNPFPIWEAKPWDL